IALVQPLVMRPLRLLALRVSAGCDRGEQVPVRAAGVEQGADPVVGEAAEPERDALDPLDQVVDRLGRSVADAGSVPRGDLVGPAHDGAAESADLRWAVLVLEVMAEPVDEGGSEVGVADLVERANYL